MLEALIHETESLLGIEKLRRLSQTQAAHLKWGMEAAGRAPPTDQGQ